MKKTTRKTKSQKKKTKQKQSSNKETKRLKRKKVVRILLTIGIILFILLALLFFIDAGILQKPKEPELFELTDECSLVMGNLMHSINDEGECRIRCINNCKIRDMNIEKTEFEAKDTACNTCNCYCK